MSQISEIIQDIYNKKRSTDEAFNSIITQKKDELSHKEFEELIDTIEIYENTLRDFRIKLRLINNKQYVQEMLKHTR